MRAHTDHFYTGDMHFRQLALLDIVIGQDDLDNGLDLFVIVLRGRFPNQLIESVETGLEQRPVLHGFVLILQNGLKVLGQVAHDLLEGQNLRDGLG